MANLYEILGLKTSGGRVAKSGLVRTEARVRLLERRALLAVSNHHACGGELLKGDCDCRRDSVHHDESCKFDEIE